MNGNDEVGAIPWAAGQLRAASFTRTHAMANDDQRDGQVRASPVCLRASPVRRSRQYQSVGNGSDPPTSAWALPVWEPIDNQ